MRMPANELLGDAVYDVANVKVAALLGHLRMVDGLQEQVAQFLAKIGEILAIDRIGNLVGLFDRVVLDGGKVLIEIPGAPRIRIAERRHDFDKPGDVA